MKVSTNNKKIYILLTRFPDVVSHTLGIIKASYYTHASIGLEEDLNTFYSFCYKGFRIEKMSVYKERLDVPFPCVVYELEVPEKAYNKTKETIMNYVNNKKEYSFCYLGVILGLLHIPHKFKNQYFCSQFVSEVLKDCNVIPLQKHTSLYFPGDFRKIEKAKLILQGNVHSFFESIKSLSIQTSNEK